MTQKICDMCGVILSNKRSSYYYTCNDTKARDTMKYWAIVNHYDEHKDLCNDCIAAINAVIVKRSVTSPV